MALITTDSDGETKRKIEQSNVTPVVVPRVLAHYAFEASYDDGINTYRSNE